MLYKDRVFIYQDANPAPGQRAFVGAFDKKTGALVYQNRLGVAQREGFSASPALVDGTWYWRTDEALLAIR